MVDIIKKYYDSSKALVTNLSSIIGSYIPTGSMVFKGSWDASTGSYPATPSAGDQWYVNVGGVVSGITYQLGDWITYSPSSSWVKTDGAPEYSLENVVTVDSDIQTVAGKIYNTIADALVYVATKSPSSSDRWTVQVSGYNNENFTVPIWVRIKGTGDSTVLAGDIDGGTFTGGNFFEYVIENCNMSNLALSGGKIINFQNCTLNSTNASSQGILVAINSTFESGNYTGHTAAMYLINSNVFGGEYPGNIIAYNSTVLALAAITLNGGNFDGGKLGGSNCTFNDGNYSVSNCSLEASGGSITINSGYTFSLINSNGGNVNFTINSGGTLKVYGSAVVGNVTKNAGANYENYGVKFDSSNVNNFVANNTQEAIEQIDILLVPNVQFWQSGSNFLDTYDKLALDTNLRPVTVTIDGDRNIEFKSGGWEFMNYITFDASGVSDPVTINVYSGVTMDALPNLGRNVIFQQATSTDSLVTPSTAQNIDITMGLNSSFINKNTSTHYFIDASAGNVNYKITMQKAKIENNFINMANESSNLLTLEMADDSTLLDNACDSSGINPVLVIVTDSTSRNNINTQSGFSGTFTITYSDSNILTNEDYSSTNTTTGKAQIVNFTGSTAYALTIPSDAIADANRYFYITDAYGNAGSNNKTIATEGAETIDGAATYVISNNNGAVLLKSDGTNLYSVFSKYNQALNTDSDVLFNSVSLMSGLGCGNLSFSGALHASGIQNVTTATAELANTDYMVNVAYTSTGACTVDIPSAQNLAGRVVVFKDTGGNAGTNNITITTEGSETIDGQATYVINEDYDSVVFFSNGTNWFIQSDLNSTFPTTIAQGDSYVEVSDSGSGDINFYTDSTKLMEITGGVINFYPGGNVTLEIDDEEIVITGTLDISDTLSVSGRTTTAGLTNTGGVIRNTTTVNAATYDLVVSDDILLVTYTSTGAVTSLTLPSAQTVDGRVITIKDAGGNASVNTITIDTEASETIDGAATAVISGDYDSLTLVSDGSNWLII